MASRIPVLLAWSGGKDAAWTLHMLRQSATHAVVGLLTTVSDGRASLQGVRVEVLRAQASAAGLPLMEVPIPPKCDNATYGAAMASALDEAGQRWPELRTMAFGDLFLEDIRAWRQQQLESYGWNLVTPLFRFDTALLARRMLDSGLRAHVCCVDTQQLDARFAGRPFNLALLEELPPGVDPCGENGEYHTCVWDGPMFAAPIRLAHAGDSLEAGRFARTDFALGE
ncbi:ATP-binding protein [Pseudoxanthomonas suwonensis]|uniref:Dph6-related ATP pyrophosphatase n=1 Tax=Pseudoxanthomonas suwonensis TaxID=314722 RepID=UPI00138F6AB0|nr:ATP-binding protein [Pseudoxanthomonas suwonensis]KAF1702804.1 ATP-binding protein [Pseudoxanthomonas suwonensis]